MTHRRQAHSLPAATPSPSGPGSTTTPQPQSAHQNLTLRPLSPVYQADQHGIYLEHLEAATTDTGAKNVALTGRYGTGKSSVLDEFERRHHKRVLRVSITTLGPDRDGEGLTNRIQKELVKQVIYRASPDKLRTSGFARTDRVTWPRALAQSGCLIALLGVALALVGWLPSVAAFPQGTSQEPVTVSAVAAFFGMWLSFVLVVTLLTAWLRRALGSRIITSLSAAGTSITLGERDDTYFDAYLEELVTHFDEAQEDFVIFEDIDRFDDPVIFDSLRELNTILNASPRRAKKAQRPLTFIYAIKDSLFEKLAEPVSDPAGSHGPGADEQQSNESEQPATTSGARSQDQAYARRSAFEQRANRTKFFDLVIPMVPFLSHRNARDVLEAELSHRQIPPGTISKALLSLVARHATDMRLLLNILNEFTVFAQKLLWVATPAPGMTADHLFALVAYKNFHLTDFEAIPVRQSALDRLDQAHRQLVRHAVSTRQGERRAALEAVFTKTQQDALADRYGAQLIAGGEYALAHRALYDQRPTFEAGDQTFTADEASTIAFWSAVATAQAVTVNGVQRESKGSNAGSVATLDQHALSYLFPQALDPLTWASAQQTAGERRTETLDNQIHFLRGAGYVDLFERRELTNAHGQPFAHVLEEHLHSEISRELVRRGYIDRNFATYTSAFYGTYAGIDAETFYYRAVQPNEMLLDHSFDSDASIATLLDQLDREDPDFYRTVSALNPQIVTYLVTHRPDRAREVAGFLATRFDADAREFMTTYLVENNAPHSELVGLIASHGWPGILDYLTSEDVPDNLRLVLVDAALQNIPNAADVALGQPALAYLENHHGQMDAFGEPQSTTQAEVIRDLVTTSGIFVTDLAKVAAPLQSLLVDSSSYVLDANNLRAALGVEGAVALEDVGANTVVRSRCLAELETYLAAVREDSATPYALTDSDTLLPLVDGPEALSASDLDDLLSLRGPHVLLDDLTLAEPLLWPTLATHGAFARTIRNVAAYIEEREVDQHLATHLTTPSPSLEVAGDATAEDSNDTDLETLTIQVALDLLNADGVLSTADRADLVSEMGLARSALPLSQITPAGDLLAQLLDRDLLEPSRETFVHFAAAGWGVVREAVKRHSKLRELLTPDTLTQYGLTAAILEDDDAAQELHENVLNHLEQFIAASNADPEMLRAAGRRAVQRQDKLSLEHISQIAAVVPDQDLVVPLLASHQGLHPDQLLPILVVLGEPYDKLTTPDAEGAVPDGDAAMTVFNRLETTGRIKFSKKKTWFTVS